MVAYVTCNTGFLNSIYLATPPLHVAVVQLTSRETHKEGGGGGGGGGLKVLAACNT